jgi:EF-hand domain pair
MMPMQIKSNMAPFENPDNGTCDAPIGAARLARRGAALARLAALTLAGLTAACAQSPLPAPDPAPAPVAAPVAPPAPAVAAPVALPPPERPAPPPGQVPAFTESNFGMAFNYLDTNKDGRISREEAARFRGVARHFDAADLNKDGVLSREEFDNAMRQALPK